MKIPVPHTCRCRPNPLGLFTCRRFFSNHLTRASTRTVHLRAYSTRTFFVTTPIFYVNAEPHIGHLHSAALADALHRTHRLLGRDSTLFSTGTDEHGLKIQKAADTAGKNPIDFCDNISSTFQKLFDEAEIEYTDFIRTTQRRHYETVAHFWKALLEGGHIYKGTYEGWYCTSDETFVSPSDIAEGKNGIKISKESGHSVEWTREENYMFRLSAFREDLKRWVAGGAIKPKKFEEIVGMWIDEGLSDLSVSRQRSRLQWGIPVPGDHSQTIYVWLDALVNYLTVAGYPDKGFLWPVDCHVIGKDILRFHGVYWPAFLMAAGLEPPRTLFCHSHWMVNDQKMSKSKGNVVDPFRVAQQYTLEGLRYFLLREAVPHSDANFTEVKMKRLINAELAGTLGNLLSRCVAPTVNRSQTFPALSGADFRASFGQDGEQLVASVRELPELVRERFLEGNFHRGLESTMAVLHGANVFVQRAEPWRLAKDPNQEERLGDTLHVVCETLRVCSILMQPILPGLTSRLLSKLGVPPGRARSWEGLSAFPSLDGQPHPSGGVRLGGGTAVVFPRIK